MSHSDDHARLFIALWLDDAARTALAASSAAWLWPPGTRRVADANLHVTLHFIGAFARDAIGALCERVASVAPRPVPLEPVGTAVWRGGIAVLRLRDEPALTALNHEIGDALAGLGIALDTRPFAPHVTLARKAWHATPPLELPVIGWRAKGFSLVESQPGPPLRYVRICAWQGAG